jgi:hypothetical protein
VIDATVERAGRALASRTSRRSFVGTVGRAFVALVGGSFVAVALDPTRAQAHHICGHTYTTNSCPHPFDPLTRVDSYGYPVHPTYGYPVDDDGDVYSSKKQSRRKICERRVPDEYPQTGAPKYGGGWTRCCSGRLRRIHDCCAYVDERINGDAAVTGYCYNGRKVFCIAYRELTTRC